jgi:hypothetical protein
MTDDPRGLTPEQLAELQRRHDEAHARRDEESADDTLEGTQPDLDTEKAVRKAVEAAFSYRGDVSLLLTDDRVVHGFIFDRRVGATLAESSFRLIPAAWKADVTERQTYRYDELVAIKFSGKDAAAGRTWEAWVAKYREKKRQGLAANLDPVSLDERESPASDAAPAPSPENDHA